MKRLTLNVSGLIFEVTDKCLERFPNTLLGDAEKRNSYFLPKERTFFFNRHRLAFEGILLYYQSYGRVVCPENVPDEVFQDELEFFDIDCDYVRSAKEAKKYVFDPKTLSAATTVPEEITLQSRVWKVLENPQSCTGAQILSTASLLMTITSIALACFYPGDKDDKKRVNRNTFPIELMCFIWFTMEYLLRLWATPSKFKFLKSWIDLTDLLTLIIFYSSLALTSTQASSTSVLRVFRLANAFRVFRLTRFSNGLRLLIYTIYKSRTDLQLLSGFLAFFILISGSMMYFAETSGPNSMFHDGGIFDGIWFSLISTTTVGYGDFVPLTVLGKCVASLTITFGAMFILLPVLKLVNSFSDALEATRNMLSVQNNEVQMQGVSQGKI